MLELSTLQPTYLTFSNSNKPCIVPSSPYNPCSTGNATSKLFKYSNSFSIFSSSVIFSPTHNCVICLTGFVYLYHTPFLSIYIGKTSYFCVSKLQIIAVPEDIETSCSVYIPPIITPTFNLFIHKFIPFILANSITNFSKL